VRHPHPGPFASPLARGSFPEASEDIQMLPSPRSTRGSTPAERAEACLAEQRRLKKEAAARREQALAAPTKRAPTGLSQRTGRTGMGRQTP
jgi:hypothetical protein